MYTQLYTIPDGIPEDIKPIGVFNENTHWSPSPMNRDLPSCSEK